jgi:serine protease Do
VSVNASAAVLPGMGGHWVLAARAHGSAGAQGYLGIDVRDVAPEQVGALKLNEARGAVIVHVDHDGPAGKAGLREHDVILQMNGQVIEGEEQLRRMLREGAAGKNITILLSRDGQVQTISTQLANRVAVERQWWQDHMATPAPGPQTESQDQIRGSGFLGGGIAAPTITAPPDPPQHSLIGTFILGSSYTGAALEMIGPQLAQFFGSQGGNGLLIRSVDPNSPAAAAGMRAGDVVVRANGIIITSTSEWSKLVHENRGKALSVVIVREKQEHVIALIPDAKKRSSVELMSIPELNLEPAADSNEAQTVVGFSWMD